MRLGQLLQKTAVLACPVSLNTEVTGISCDTRTLQKGDLFVAIRGSSLDGEQYIWAARQKGAACIVSEAPGDWIRVADARQALAQLSAAFYGFPARDLTMVAVTGTNGKSSVTWMLKQVLEKTTGQKVGLLGTLENHLGGPVEPAGRTTPAANELHRLLAVMRDNGCKYAVMEASSHAIVQKRVAGIQFAAGAFTNLSRDHLDYHKTMEAYCDAKRALFSQCQRAVGNADDPWYPRVLKNAPAGLLTTSAKVAADLYAKDISLQARGVHFTAVYRNGELPVFVPIPGLFTVYNALTVIALAVSLEISFADAAAALRDAEGLKGRVEVVPTPGKDFTVILDYAHTPDGMEQVLTTLRELCKGRLICLFGCGGDRDPGKRAKMGEISTTIADVSILTSDNPRFEPPNAILQDILQGIKPGKNYKVLENRVQAMRYAIDIGKKDDIIVLLGKGHETYQEVCGEKRPFDEREILRKLLAEKR